MSRQKNRAQSNLSKISTWIALCLLVMASTAPAAHTATYAQGTAPGWTEPEDISTPLSLGSRPLWYAARAIHIRTSMSCGAKVTQMVPKSTIVPTRTAAYRPPLDVLALPDPLAVELSAAISAPDPTIHLVWTNQYTQGEHLL